MEQEVEELAGERYRHEAATEGQRWGGQPGYVLFGGAKVPVERPRVRSKASEQELPLESYRNFQRDVRLEQAVMDQMAIGLSTRNYEPSIRAVCEAYGVKKSSVSRRFIDGSRKALDELMNRDLRPLDLCVLLLDGIERGGQCLMVALGLDGAGQKHALGLWQGATENATVCRELLGNLIQRGVDPERKYLFILDGSKALSSAVARMFAGSAIQRCQWHIAGRDPRLPEGWNVPSRASPYEPGSLGSGVTG
jgi:transposase-like protein